MNGSYMYQVSTLQALSMGYTRPVVDVAKLLDHGSIGLGTFSGVDGEMIVLDGKCYRAAQDGSAEEASPKKGVPFAAVAQTDDWEKHEIGKKENIDSLKEWLTLKIEEGFGLNSMHVARIDGCFEKVYARSESPVYAHHVELKEMLSRTQRDFLFESIRGSLVCVYYPDYMDGINASGWHLHFISEDRKKGGHVFELDMKEGRVQLAKLTTVQIRLPDEPAFDTYSLKEASADDIKAVEQGKG
jgi:acetolactate decarboxylase